MRVLPADERDSTWEDLEPRFRLFLFSGPGNAVQTIDFLDTSIDEIRRELRIIADDDRRLWSLALVRGEGRDRGLVWLSGYDYNDAPTEPAEWRRRREMQERYLAARSRRGEPPLLPDGRRVIRMFSGGTSSPLWESFTDAYVVDPRDLGVSDDLSRELHAWDAAIQNGGLDAPAPANTLDHGLALWRRLRDELAPIAEVRPEFWV